MKRIVVIGAGFAGLWSAVGAARKLDELRVRADRGGGRRRQSGTPYHSIRVRNYETEAGRDARAARRRARADRRAADRRRCLRHRRGEPPRDGRAPRPLELDLRPARLRGGQPSSCTPRFPASTDYSFDVDTLRAPASSQAHLRALAVRAASAGPYTAVVVGAGLTGIELAAELPARFRGIVARGGSSTACASCSPIARRKSARRWAARSLSSNARCDDLGVEMLAGVSLAIARRRWRRAQRTASAFEAATVLWCGGMRANALTAQFPVTLDPFGRVPVDAFLRVEGVAGVFAAGDCACVLIDGARPS